MHRHHQEAPPLGNPLSSINTSLNIMPAYGLMRHESGLWSIKPTLYQTTKGDIAMPRKQDLIQVLYKLKPEELAECLSPCGELAQYLISVAASDYAKKSELTPEISRYFIHLFLAVATEIGGEMVYMPYSPSKIHRFADTLTSFVLNGTFSLDAIRKFGVYTETQKDSGHLYLWLQRIEVIVDVMREESQQFQVGEKTKYNIIFTFFSGFLLSLSGRAQYFPRGCALVSMLKRKGICMDFTGDNIYPLTRKYKISTSMVYFYLKEDREKRRKSW
mgnify:CR=1 FL=1